ncbi:hypothetical protein [Lutibacter citreus]|uniref:hypothetical protein n=1 Tax=Lutibacter citreus TaxID=2138210 RepID=UPI000DBE02BC|nr:hypothetical protein [Lutibacter citreus]
MKKLLFLLALFISFNLTAQEEKKQDSTTYLNPFRFVPKLKLYLDCNLCDVNYIQQKSSKYFEFVRDQKYADVHIMVRSQNTGSGGLEHELEYFGKNFYGKAYNKHSFSTPPTNSFSENRDLMLQNIRMGSSIFLYKHYDKYESLIVNSNEEKNDSINKPVPKNDTQIEVKDKWNSWVFNIGLNGGYSGQETSENSNLGASFSMKRVTNKNKFLIRTNFNTQKSDYDYGDFKISSTNKTINVNIYDAFSISNHWSIGAFLNGGRSTYANQKLYIKFKPAIEYSFFDYKESATKQITISYRVGGVKYKYDEKTIFNKSEEFLGEQSAELSGSVQQKWGSVNGSVLYDSYLNDSSLNAFNFRLSTNFRVASGLTFNISGNYGITNNQINLAGGDLSLDELLLRQKQVNSGYNFFTTVGLNYSFGSMFSSVINPRFDF